VSISAGLSLLCSIARVGTDTSQLNMHKHRPPTGCEASLLNRLAFFSLETFLCFPTDKPWQ
jgi:hypothetical protein